MKAKKFLSAALFMVMGVGQSSVFAQSQARTSDVIGTYYGAIQCVVDTDGADTHLHNFPQLILTGLISFYMGWNNAGFHQEIGRASCRERV